MSYLLFLLREMLTAGGILLPGILILSGLVFRRPRRFPGYLAFALYLAAISLVVGLPTVETIPYLGFEPNINYLPFADLASDWVDVMLNTLLFLPLGFLLPLLWRDFGSFGKTLAFGFCLSFCIEFLQLFTSRATDINDLITNTLGTVLGYILAALINPPTGAVCSRQELPAICFTVAFCMFFLQPFAFGIVGQML